MPKKPLHELRYGGTVYAVSDSCETLQYLKAKATLNKEVQFPEMLHIYFEGKTEWIFDSYMDEKEASRFVAAGGERDV